MDEIKGGLIKDWKGCGLTGIAVSQSVEIARYISPPEETHDLGFYVSIGRLQEIIERQKVGPILPFIQHHMGSSPDQMFLLFSFRYMFNKQKVYLTKRRTQ